MTPEPCFGCAEPIPSGEEHRLNLDELTIDIPRTYEATWFHQQCGESFVAGWSSAVVEMHGSGVER